MGALYINDNTLEITLMEELTNIPGNKDSILTLRGCIQQNNAIAFVGAGASAPLYPVWNTLINSLAEEAYSLGLVDDSGKNYYQRLAMSEPQKAVRLIKTNIEKAKYQDLLSRMFSPKRGEDGNCYTRIHAALMKISFRGFVTTNYDPGLTEARMVERPDIKNTGYATWRDREELIKWNNEEIFNEGLLPILHAHGHYQQSDSIILSSDEYDEAYKPGIYRRTFENLCTRCRLVYIGYSFRDPFLSYIHSNSINLYANVTSYNSDHVALIGFHDGEIPSQEERRHYKEVYNADVVFYPIKKGRDGRDDHSSLLALLSDVTTFSSGKHVASINQIGAASKILKEMWVHETTDDERFSGRELEIRRLNRWAGDKNIQCIAVTGMGGQGKTALIGHWLKRLRPADLWGREGIFFWSFYTNRDVKSFMRTLLELEYNESKNVHELESDALVRRCLSLIKNYPIVIVLDGLELLQERPGAEVYGTLLEDDLRDLLTAAIRERHGSLIVLTSRFSFSDLMNYSGKTLSLLELNNLSPRESGILLESCGVGGLQDSRESIGKKLEGHPLALRIFAAVIAVKTEGDPTRLWDIIFAEGDLRYDNRFESKLKRLLRFYEENLPIVQRAILEVISLFNAPEEEATIVRMVERRLAKSRNGGSGRRQIPDSLEWLYESGLLLREHANNNLYYYCHPILRDHFRKSLINDDRDMATEAALLLTDRPGDTAPKTIKDILPILDGIELFIDSGLCDRASEYFEDKLQGGKCFLSIPALQEGRRCTLGFIGDSSRRSLCERQLPRRLIYIYFNQAAKFAGDAGEVAEAASLYESAEKLCTQASDAGNLAVILRNKSIMLAYAGRLEEARKCIEESVKILKDKNEDFVNYTCKYDLAFILGIMGDVKEAMHCYLDADDIRQQSQQTTRGGNAEIYSEWEIRCASIYALFGLPIYAEKIAKKALDYSLKSGMKAHEAAASAVLGSLDIYNKKYNSARKYLANAETIARRGYMYMELPKILLTLARLEINERNNARALRYIDEVMQIVVPRELCLIQAEALILRGNIMLSSANYSVRDNRDEPLLSALDDGELAHRLSRKTKNMWAQKDSMDLLAKVHSGLGDVNNEKRYRMEYKAMSAMLKL